MYFSSTKLFAKYLENLERIPRLVSVKPPMCHNTDAMCHKKIVYRGTHLRPPPSLFPECAYRFWILKHKPITSNHLCPTIATQYTFSQRDVYLYLTTNLFTNFELLISNES